MAPGFIESFNFKNNYRLFVDHLIQKGLNTVKIGEACFVPKVSP